MKTNFKKIILAILLTICSIFQILPNNLIQNVQADVLTYTDVLEDLEKDRNFNKDNYPYIDYETVSNLNNDSDENNNINLLQVIQIAETENKELLIYVYQPCKSDDLNLKATTINFSTTINDKVNYCKYELEILNTNSVFDKYIVKDFTVLDDAIRYYEITEINREYNKIVDGEISENEDVTTTEYAHTVAQQWKISTYEDFLSYEMKSINVIVFTNQYAGTIRYPNGFYLVTNTAIDSHFLGFNTDRKIENLLEVEMEYDLNYYHYYDYNASDLEAPTLIETTIKCKDTIYCEEVSTTGGWFASSVTWQRIQSKDKFIETCKNNDYELKSNTLEGLENCSWVISFKETNYTYKNILPSDTLGIAGQIDNEYSFVTEIDVLRLKYITDNTVYNLGVVSNTITPDKEIDGKSKNDPLQDFLSALEEIMEKIGMLLGVLMLVTFISFCSPIFGLVFNFIGSIISILLFPFKILKKSKKKKKP